MFRQAGSRIAALAWCVAFLLSAYGVGADIQERPLSCFVVHCEPTNANEIMFLELEGLVSLAESYEVPLTIDFTAQWAEMILGDERKVKAVDAWIEHGHEIGAHHHAYWALLDRAAQWDGYTNTPVSDLLPIYQTQYRGTMNDYMDLVNALPGDRLTACMGLDGDQDRIDWPASLQYSTTGNLLEHCVSTPQPVSYPSGDAWHISHGLILQDPGALVDLYDATPATEVFCVVGHVYNYQENPRPFEAWFRSLAVSDPDGLRRRIVSEAIEEWRSDDI